MAAAPAPKRIAIRTDDGEWHDVGVLDFKLEPAETDDSDTYSAAFTMSTTLSLNAIDPAVLALAFPDIEDQPVTEQEAYHRYGNTAPVHVEQYHDDDIAARGDDRRAEI